jgi:hypothetical protein
MNTTELVMQKVRQLSPQQQQEVLDFIEFLFQKHQRLEKVPSLSPFGLWADLKIDLTETDVIQARQEMWSNFPREDI